MLMEIGLPWNYSDAVDLEVVWKDLHHGNVELMEEGSLDSRTSPE